MPYLLGHDLASLPEFLVQDGLTLLQPYSDIVALSPTDIWATPYCCYGNGSGVLPQNGAVHFDGTSWTRHAGGGHLFRVTAVGSEVWYGRDYMYPTGGNSVAGLLRAETSGFTQYMADPKYNAFARVSGIANDLRTVSIGSVTRPATGPSDVLHFDGSTWQRVAVPLATKITAISGTSDHDVLIAGDHGYLAHYNGSELALLAPASPATQVTRVWAAASGTEIVAFFVGPQTISTFDSMTKQWRNISPTPGAGAGDISGTSTTDVWAASNAMQMLHWDGTGWTPTTVADVGEYLTGVPAHATNDVWAFGRNDVATPVMFHFDGAMWTRMTPPTSAPVQAIAGSASDAWLAAGSLFRYNGEQWSQVTTPVTDTWKHVAVQAPDDVYIAGARYVLHWDGEMLTPNDVGFDIVAINTSPTGAVVSGYDRVAVIDAGGVHTRMTDSPYALAGVRSAGAVTWVFTSRSGVMRFGP